VGDGNKFNLHDTRLNTTDELGHRVYIHPDEVKGRFRGLRNIFYWILVTIYMVLPWLHFKGKQVILLDIPAREFTFFGITFL